MKFEDFFLDVAATRTNADGIHGAFAGPHLRQTKWRSHHGPTVRHAGNSDWIVGVDPDTEGATGERSAVLPTIFRFLHARSARFIRMNQK
jgi:hypothetical protein